MGSALDILQAGRPPRGVFLDYPLGHTAGRPFDADNQRAVVRDALRAFESIQTPGEIVALDYQWSDNDGWKAENSDASTGDFRPPRSTEPRYQTENDRVLAEAAGADA
jgi:hypothetical protein